MKISSFLRFPFLVAPTVRFLFVDLDGFSSNFLFCTPSPAFNMGSKASRKVSAEEISPEIPRNAREGSELTFSLLTTSPVKSFHRLVSLGVGVARL